MTPQEHADAIRNASTPEGQQAAVQAASDDGYNVTVNRRRFDQTGESHDSVEIGQSDANGNNVPVYRQEVVRESSGNLDGRQVERTRETTYEEGFPRDVSESQTGEFEYNREMGTYDRVDPSGDSGGDLPTVEEPPAEDPFELPQEPAAADQEPTETQPPETLPDGGPPSESPGDSPIEAPSEQPDPNDDLENEGSDKDPTCNGEDCSSAEPSLLEKIGAAVVGAVIGVGMGIVGAAAVTAAGVVFGTAGTVVAVGALLAAGAYGIYQTWKNWDKMSSKDKWGFWGGVIGGGMLGRWAAGLGSRIGAAVGSKVRGIGTSLANKIRGAIRKPRPTSNTKPRPANNDDYVPPRDSDGPPPDGPEEVFKPPRTKQQRIRDAKLNNRRAAQKSRRKAEEARRNGDEKAAEKFEKDARGYERENEVIDALGDVVEDAGVKLDPVGEVDVVTRTEAIEVKSGGAKPSRGQLERLQKYAQEKGKKPVVQYDDWPQQRIDRFETDYPNVVFRPNSDLGI